MKFMFKKVLSLLLCITMITACTACGNDKNTQETKSQKEVTKEHEALTITSFNNLIKEDFIEAFHKEYPEVKLDINSYSGINGSGYALHSLENGDIPDIYITSQSFSKQSQEEYLLDLSNYDFVNSYSNTLLDSLDVNGSIYLLPSGYTLTGIYYNKTILEENHWEVPTSFKELVALSKKIEKAGYQTMGHGMSLDGFPFNYFFNIGNTVYFGTPEGTEWKEEFSQGDAKAVGNKKLKETIQYFNQWIKHGFITANHMGTEDFFEGKCVFFLCLGLSEYTNTTEDGKTYEFGTIPWLSEDGSNNMLTRNVSRYMGINKSLAEKGKEQKLEDALKLLNYVSTVEGQKALMSSSSEYMSSLNESTLPEDSPYQEIVDLVNEGRTVPLLYVGWEDLIIPIAGDIKKFIQGDMNADKLMEAFDKTKEGLKDGSSDDIYAIASETLTMEETAKLIAVAEGKAVDADCAMISLNEYHGNDLSNNLGLGWYLYQGDINSDILNVIRPRAETISILEMTGAEIKEMQTKGFDLNENENPYPYFLTTKNDMELEDTTTYRLAISTNELTKEMLEKATETESVPREAIIDYLKSLKTVSADVIVWE